MGEKRKVGSCGRTNLRVKLRAIDYKEELSRAGCTETFPGSGYTQDEVDFIKGMGRYIQETGRKFPQFTEMLAVAHALGWRRVAEAGPLPTFPVRVDDTEEEE